MTATNEALEWENRVVLATIQALLGLASPNLRAVSVEVDGRVVTLHFAVLVLDRETSEDIEDIIGDVQGLLWTDDVDVRHLVREDLAGPEWEGRHYRMVLLAKSQRPTETEPCGPAQTPDV